jgi:hypothetical protein
VLEQANVATWDCRRCLKRRYAVERPAFCATCGRSNSYVASSVPVPNAIGRRVRRVPPPARPLDAAPSAPELETDSASDRAPETASSEPESGQVEPIRPAPAPAARPTGGIWASEVVDEEIERATSDWSAWRYVTSDLPLKKLTLIGAPAGTGKTRALVRVARGVIRTMRRPVVFVCIDAMQPAEMRACARDVGFTGEDLEQLLLVDACELEQLEQLVAELRPALVVIDAFANLTVAGEACLAGTHAEKTAVPRILAMAEAANAAIALVLHMQGSGQKYSIGRPTKQSCHLIVDMQKVEEPFPGVLLRIGPEENPKNRCGPAHRKLLLEFDDRGALKLHRSETRLQGAEDESAKGWAKHETGEMLTRLGIPREQRGER